MVEIFVQNLQKNEVHIILQSVASQNACTLNLWSVFYVVIILFHIGYFYVSVKLTSVLFYNDADRPVMTMFRFFYLHCVPTKTRHGTTSSSVEQYSNSFVSKFSKKFRFQLTSISLVRASVHAERRVYGVNNTSKY